ncbi:MAG TPA: multicopper oxidase domain-containing protein [Anaeromyxobacteraceae bacterium]|nr:multicopper oxidase domain-containing protein [Anaeromyxobacteraceae bacterium]
MQSNRRFTPLPIAGAALGLALAVPALAAQTPQIPLPAKNIPQFVDPLPVLNLTPATFGTTGLRTLVVNQQAPVTPLQLSMCEFKSRILPSTFVPPVGSTYAGFTWTWGYIPGAACPTAAQDSYIGPVLVNTRGTPTSIRYANALPTVLGTNLLAFKYGTDQTLHWADPLGATPAGMTSMGPEGNMCHMQTGSPPAVGVGIPGYKTECSLNFGEWWDPVNLVGGYSAVGIPAVPHLHGGEVPPVLDGGPDAWFTSDGLIKGHDFYSNPNFAAAANEAVYSYPNSQGAAPLWFHDHVLGATRLNVYAGIAGVYYLLDPAQEAWFTGIKMRPVQEVVPLVLQDRMFDTNGQLYFPNDTSGGVLSALNPQHPYWVPEFIGDTIVVNGKVWPYLQVEPRRYRFLFLNGSNARTYEMFLISAANGKAGPTMWVIGNDGGFLDAPAPMARLVVMPGERYEVIVDFTKVAGQTLILRNTAKAPYPGGAAPQGTTTGRILQFRVSATPVADTTYDPASGIALRPAPILRLTNPATGTLAAGVALSKTRQLTLNEVPLAPQTAIDPVTGLTTAYPGGPEEILLNNTRWSGDTKRTYGDFQPVTVNGITEGVSEMPIEGTTELWEIVNTTMDSHPIHTHLATFQIMNRQSFDTKAFFAAYSLAFPGNGTPACPAKVFCSGFGPPLAYGPSVASGGKYGGNPDVLPFLRNGTIPPAPGEVGWKDTLQVPPGMVTRLVVRWAPQDAALALKTTGYPFSPNDGYDPATLVANGNLANTHGYVWHCHILDHEDNEMMRPDVIEVDPAAPRTYLKGVNY